MLSEAQKLFSVKICLKITSAIFVTGVKGDISGSLNRDTYVSILMVSEDRDFEKENIAVCIFEHAPSILTGC